MYRSLFSSSSRTTYLGRLTRPRGPTPTSAQVKRAAADAISTLKRVGVKDACFVGGMACNLFGNLRQPNDLDILCLTTEWEQETLKRKLVEANTHFYLIDSRDPLAKYRVLWYHLTDTDSCVKVDLLFPGVLDIPAIPSSNITHANAYRLPCAPLSLVLLLKLQAWIHHGEALLWRYREKQPTDARDIDALLPIAVVAGVQLRAGSGLPPTFVAVSAGRAKRYIATHPHSRKYWIKLGLLVEVKRTEPRRLAKGT